MSDTPEPRPPAATNTSSSHGEDTPGHESPFVQPKTYLRPEPRVMEPKPLTPLDKEQMHGLKAIRDFLKVRTSYDVLPLSFRLIILNTDLLVKKSLSILLQNGIVSAPLWDSQSSTFAGLLTTSDYINVIQYYWQNPDALNQIDQFRLSSLRDIEKAINVLPIETLSVHPMRPLYEACRRLLESRARRIPLVDIDDETKREMVVSVITQYRILKFIAVNVTETEMLKKPVSEIGLGTYGNLQTASMDTPVIDVIHMMVKKSISSVPIVDEDYRVLNVFEAVDVIAIINGGVYDELTASVGEALSKRAPDFAGIYTCGMEDRLDTIFDTLRKSRVHRLVVIDEDSRLKGVISLSDILKPTARIDLFSWTALHSDTASREAAEASMMFSNLIDSIEQGVQILVVILKGPSHHPEASSMFLCVELCSVPSSHFGCEPFIVAEGQRYRILEVSKNPYRYPTRGVYYPLSSRASSATLFLSQQVPYCHVDGATDLVDISIAEGLLQTESPRVPQRRSSFNHSATARQSRFPIDNSKQQLDARPSRNRHLRQGISSNTWTSSSGEGSEDGGNDDRTPFVSEYNKLAKKYGIQTIVPDEFIAVHVDKLIITTKPGRWILRKLLRRTSSIQVSRQKAEKNIRHKRSISDISLRLRPKKDTLVGKELEELIRLCGASPLYLPVEYAAGTLAVPTCFRATAQYLVQHAATSRGIFRIPGSHSAINALYNHYASQDGDGGVINGTVRCPTLPEHIQCGVHDVASAFKKFLAGLPGGILGKAWLFNAFVSIYTQLDAKAEFMRTKQSKVRARLIALAIAAIATRYQRELICAVLGLLSMIGRAAETAPREDENGRPLPISDLMGYEALGIVFGPLLIGNLLESHDLCPTGPHGSSIFIQRSPPKSSRGKHNKNKSCDDSITLRQGTDKIRIINSITEMLITHWRDVVRQMKNMGALKTMTQHHGLARADTSGLATPLLPELFAIRRPCDWDMDESSLRHVDRSRSPTPSSRNGQVNMLCGLHNNTSTPQDDMLSVRKLRPRPMSSQILSGAKSMSILAPTIEETPVKQEYEQPMPESVLHITQNAVHFHERGGVKAKRSTQTFHTAYLEPVDRSKLEQPIAEKKETVSQTVKQDLVSTELNKSNDKEAPRDDQTELKDIRRMVHGRCLSEENTKRASIKAYQEVSNQISMLPLHDTQKQSEGLSKQLTATSPPLGSSNDIRNQPEAFSQVPNGIVSIHLRRIAASDPGLDPPSGFAGILKTDHRSKFPQKRRPNTATGGSHTFENFPKDPLSRVSREEDIASLESLAQIIQSQDESICIDSVKSLDLITRPDTPVNVVKSRTRSTIPVAFSTEHQSIESLSKPDHRKSLPEDPVLVLKTDLPTDTKTLPTTPRRSATESSVGHRSGGSVRALAARFGNVGMNARQTPSPVHTPHPRVWHGSLVEKAVVAPYTVNTSPVPMAQKLTKSDTSLQSIRNPIQAKIRTVASSSRFQRTTSPNQPKPLFSSSYLNHESGPPLWPTLRPVNRSPRQNSDMVQVGRNSLTLPPFSSILHRTGDGYVSFALSRKSSLGTILPRHDEPQVDRYVDFARPKAVHSDHHSSPLENSTSSSFANNRLSSYSVGSQKTKIQSTSILYTQIQYLSKQLRSKAHEADHLRRQLETKDSLNDLRTLNEQLKQAKRDLTVWRGRAEVAEKRLKMLSQISQKEADEEVVDEPLDTALSVFGERNLTDKEARSKTQIRNELHGFDGISTERILLGSEGTIRHTSPVQWYGSEIELNIA